MSEDTVYEDCNACQEPFDLEKELVECNVCGGLTCEWCDTKHCKTCDRWMCVVCIDLSCASGHTEEDRGP